MKERFPGRSTGSYSILKVSSEPEHPAILADSDIQFQDSSKVNYSTIKVGGHSVLYCTVLYCTVHRAY